jgi:hypothetical protein
MTRFSQPKAETISDPYQEKSLVSYEAETPFDSIESAHEYLSLLIEAAHEARDGVANDLAPAGDSRYDRSAAVLQLVSYSLEKLEKHVKTSRRILNDLRTLRRLLLAERIPAALPTLPRRRTSRVTGSPTKSNYA